MGIKDVVPKLLEKIQADFQSMFDNNKKIESLYELVRDGTATYKEVNEFAIETGEILANSFKKNLSSDVLPDGKMYFNIANRIIPQTLRKNYELVTEVGQYVQKRLNENAGIGIRAIKPEINQERIEGLVNKVSTADLYDSVSWVLTDPVVNFTQSIVDDMIKANAEFQYNAGMSPEIIRTAESKCCEWCSKLEGKYRYPDVPKDVYRRHERCRCIVEYDPKTGKYQNVHSKKWLTAETRQAVEKRKSIGMNENTKLSPQKGIDVTDEYERNKYPGQGEFVYEDGYEKDAHKEEIRVAQWLHKNLGGDLRLLNESSIDGVKTPDYVWSGKYWELKSTTTEKSANSAIRKGIKQIAENPGGIILNYDTDIDLQQTLEVIEKRMKGSKQSDIPVDIIIIKKEKMIAVLRY